MTNGQHNSYNVATSRLILREGMREGGRDKWVVAIGVIKLLKGVLLAALGIGALKLLHKDVADELTRWIQRLNVDPNSHYFQKLMEKVGGLDNRKVIAATVGTFVYAALFLTEGIGLLLRKRWGEYFTVVVTGSFLPLEVYELIKKFNAVRLIVIIANAAIVAYLVWRLKTSKGKA